jgi:uncharacterized membrane protein YeaQ/YmgE (transglycosylase-associated protein family)
LAYASAEVTFRSLALDVFGRVGQTQATAKAGRRAEGDPPMNVDAQKLIIWAIIGIVAGWLASVVIGGGGGLLRYLITGLIGAFVGGVVFHLAGWRLNLGNEWLEQIVIAAIGAIIVVILARIVV